MTGTTTFGQWLKQRRKALDITQEELAQCVGCAVVTIYKIEADDRRPSKQIAGLLAQHLAIPPPDRDAFVTFARTGPQAAASAMPWGTPFHPPNNLPSPPTPLIGRVNDIAAVGKRLLRDDTQLLTLVGPPGIGKSRLGLAVAFAVLDAFPDGVFLILLAPLHDPDDMPTAIVQALGLQEADPISPLERLKHHLTDKQLLLVLDNFEQILAAAPYIADLLAVCPFIKCLITSRAPLRIRRERQYPVPALTLPDLSHLPEAEDLHQIAAVELFVERARAVQPDFAITSENVQPVAVLCRRLGGVPLAIELISARVKLLPPAHLLARLHGHLMLYSDGLRDLEPRHRTLSKAIGWSYDLLDTQEQSLFSRLGVFAGGWTLEAAEAVCQPATSVIDGLASLLDKSLLQKLVGMSNEPRYTMLEVVREYALERLAENGESRTIQLRYARFFLQLAKTPRGVLPPTVPQALWLNQMDLEYDNLRAALKWCFANDLELGLHLATAVGDYWIKRGRLIEGRFWIEKYINACRGSVKVLLDSLREALRCASVLAYFQDDMAAVREHAEALRELGRERKDKASLAFALFFLGQDALQQEHFEQAKPLFEQSLALSRQIEDNGHTASTLLMLGLVAGGQKDYPQALAYNAESLAMYQRLGDRWLESFILENTADIWAEQGDYQKARALSQRSLSISQELGDRRTLSQILEQLAGLFDLEGDSQRATHLLGAVEALREIISVPVEPLDRAKRERLVARLRTSLDENTFATAWTEGKLMTLEQAVMYALSEE